MVYLGFWINGVSTNIGQNFAETLQFEDLAVKNFFLFYYVHIFVKEKNLELLSNSFFINIDKKNLKHFAEFCSSSHIYAHNKRKKSFDLKVFKLQHFNTVFPNVD